MTAERLAAYLETLPFDTVGIHLGSAPERTMAVEACRLAHKQVVALDERPAIVITADGIVEDGVVRPLKEEVEDAQHVIVFRLIGDAPLAPTMDAYLDVVMIDGSDVWFDDL